MRRGSGAAVHRARWAAPAAPLDVLGRLLLQLRRQRSVAGGAGGVKGVHVEVGGENRRQLGQRAGQDVDDAARRVGGGQHLPQRHRRQRPFARRHHHARVPLTMTGATRPEPRATTRLEPAPPPRRPVRAWRSEVRAGGRVRRPVDLGDLVRPAGVPDPSVDGGGDSGVGRPGRQSLGRHHLGGELGPPPLKHLGHAVQHLTPVVGGGAAPPRHGAARRHHRVAAVLARRRRRVGQEAALGVGDDVGAAALRAREGAAHIELVGLAHVEALGHQCSTCR